MIWDKLLFGHSDLNRSRTRLIMIFSNKSIFARIRISANIFNASVYIVVIYKKLTQSSAEHIQTRTYKRVRKEILRLNKPTACQFFLTKSDLWIRGAVFDFSVIFTCTQVYSCRKVYRIVWFWVRWILPFSYKINDFKASTVYLVYLHFYCCKGQCFN